MVYSTNKSATKRTYTARVKYSSGRQKTISSLSKEEVKWQVSAGGGRVIKLEWL